MVEHSAIQKHLARVGRREEVIVEGMSKRNEGVITGRTRQNKLVHFPHSEVLRPGTYAFVDITYAAPHFLKGELVEVTHVPTHKVRVPLLSAS